jgi:glucose-6-phosphate 1-dehydrogenase
MSELPRYNLESSGPTDADALIARDGRKWREPILW